MAWIGDAFRFLALQAIPEDPDKTAKKAQQLVFQLAGLFVSAVLVMLAGACLVLGLVFSLMSEMPTLPNTLLILAALIALMGAVGWMVFANATKLGAMVSDTFAPPQRPVDMAVRKVTRVVNAFMDGLEEPTRRNGREARW
jgi:uncharacterized membrane protein